MKNYLQAIGIVGAILVVGVLVRRELIDNAYADLAQTTIAIIGGVAIERFRRGGESSAPAPGG